MSGKQCGWTWPQRRAQPNPVAVYTIYVGTGNGSPWNIRFRSEGKGDNLFLCSIVALDPDTGKYKWHYQENPGESWDYNSGMPMILTDIDVYGRKRKVLYHAPKNGFFYVIDRTNGKLVSAKNYVPVTWTSGIDPATGRPIDVANNRFTDGPFKMTPGTSGSHNWHPMALDPKTGIVYFDALLCRATLIGRELKFGRKSIKSDGFLRRFPIP
jgi:quinohemoprotein ethanol dehydrogenase